MKPHDALSDGIVESREKAPPYPIYHFFPAARVFTFFTFGLSFSGLCGVFSPTLSSAF
jgi:hypothetical protein